MQLSLSKHCKSCGKSHGNERLKRKALRRPRKTDIEGADVNCWGTRLMLTFTQITNYIGLADYTEILANQCFTEIQNQG